jgi:hypothetical protein
MWSVYFDTELSEDQVASLFNPYPANVEKKGELLIVFHYTGISNTTQRYTVNLYLKTALHVSGDISTHHQERIHL